MSGVRCQVEARRYRDGRGRVLFVSDGVSSGKQWFTAHRKPSGSLKRLLRNALPVRTSRGEAQADLDAYAVSQQWRLVCDDPPDAAPPKRRPDSPGELALEACRLLTEWAEGQSAFDFVLQGGLTSAIGLAENALRALAESEAQP